MIHSLKRSFSEALLSNVAIMGLNFLSVALTSASAGLTTRGAVTALLGYPPLLASICCVGLHTSFAYLAQSIPEEAEDYFKCLLLSSVGMLVVAVVASIAISPYLAGKLALDVAAVRNITILLTLCTLISAIFSGACQTNRTFSNFNIARIIAPACTVLLVALVAVTGQKSALPYLICYAAGFAASAIYALFVCGKVYKLTGSVSRRSLRSLSTLGLRFWISDVLNVLVWQVDKIVMIALALPLKDLGIYTIVSAISRGIGQIPVSMAQALLAKAMGSTKAAVAEKTTASVRIILIFTMLVAFGATLGAVAVSIFNQGDILKFSIVLGVLSVDACVAGGSALISQAFSAIGEPQRGAIRQLVGAICATIFTYLFGGIWGVYGVAMGLFLASSIKLAVAFWLFLSTFRVRGRDLLPARKDLDSIVGAVKMRLAK